MTSGGAPITYSSVQVEIRFEPGSATDPLTGYIDAAHDDAYLVFAGRLRFRAAGVTGFGACFTNVFQVTASHPGTSPPPGTNYLSQLDLTGGIMSPGTVSTSALCDAAAVAFVNSTFGLSSSASFYVWKATLDPALADIEGSY